MALIPKFYLDAVVSVGVETSTGVICWIGTGFFVFKRIDDESALPFLVTNRHVLEGKREVIIRMIEKDTSKLQKVKLTLINSDNKKRYSVHDNPAVDIAVVRLAGNEIMNNHLQFSAFDIDEHTLCSFDLAAQGGEAGTQVYMLGFPMELVDVDSNAPICRGGYIARMDKAEIEKSKLFLLDIQNFPGNSGSPIITRPEVVGISNTPVLNKSVLIGVVKSYLPYTEKLINQQTQQVVEIRSENSGIALAHPVELIKEVIEKEAVRENK